MTCQIWTKPGSYDPSNTNYMPNFNIYYKGSLVMAIRDITSVCSTSLTRQMGKASPPRCFEHVVMNTGLMNRKPQNCGRSNKPGLERLQP